MSINLGDKVKDSISGFAGIVTGYYTYLNGCVRLQIEPDKLDKEGKPIDARIFDMEQLVLVKAAKSRAVERKGGPRSDPAPRTTPSR